MSSFLGSENQASFLKPKERLLSISDLLGLSKMNNLYTLYLGNNKFKEFEHLIDPRRE